MESLINVTSSRDVPFHQLQLLQCLHQGATFVPLWSPREKTIIIIWWKHLYSKILGLMRPLADNQKEILVGMARSVHV